MEGLKIKCVNYAGQKTICESYTQMKGMFEDFIKSSLGWVCLVSAGSWLQGSYQNKSIPAMKVSSLEEVLHIFSPKQGVSLFSFSLKWKTHLEINHFLF